ncbi:Proteasome activator complex subunit 4 [Sphaceloma murrayae]|uniref:Proteasome activator complex subunit 4 n=1 Tax=Sphaceloma murrayae TaxID=2082308 RepID=A0A2K1R252_9PEZI|nr:Proteasome activator complex subunit 4 [Sphaceloma murrayae]
MCTYQDTDIEYAQCEKKQKHIVTRRKYSLCRDPEPDPNTDDRHCWDSVKRLSYPEVSTNHREDCPACKDKRVTIVVEYE